MTSAAAAALSCSYSPAPASRRCSVLEYLTYDIAVLKYLTHDNGVLKHLAHEIAVLFTRTYVYIFLNYVAVTCTIVQNATKSSKNRTKQEATHSITHYNWSKRVMVARSCDRLYAMRLVTSEKH